MLSGVVIKNEETVSRLRNVSFTFWKHIRFVNYSCSVHSWSTKPEPVNTLCRWSDRKRSRGRLNPNKIKFSVTSRVIVLSPDNPHKLNMKQSNIIWMRSLQHWTPPTLGLVACVSFVGLDLWWRLPRLIKHSSLFQALRGKFAMQFAHNSWQDTMQPWKTKQQYEYLSGVM